MTNKDKTKPKKSILKKWWFWVIAIFIIIIIASAGGDEKEETTPEQQSKQQQPQTQESPQNLEKEQKVTWQKVKSWSGTGIKKTEPFTIIGDQWRINWKNKGGDFGGGILQVYVYKPGESFPEELLANTTEVSSDSSYIYKKGTFYLDISSANTSWEIELEELK
jgi:hypothetical protein